MKKFLLVALAAFPCFVCNAQFVITPDGLRSSADTSKVYIVMQHPGSTAEDNYKVLKELIVKSYVSAKNVLTEANGNVLSVHSVYEFPVKVSVNCTGELDYIVTYTCKDDRVRLEITINGMGARVGNGVASPIYFTPGGGFGSSSIFDKRGNVKQADFKQKSEAFLNQLAQEAIDTINRKSSEDNW